MRQGGREEERKKKEGGGARTMSLIFAGDAPQITTSKYKQDGVEGRTGRRKEHGLYGHERGSQHTERLNPRM